MSKSKHLPDLSGLEWKEKPYKYNHPKNSPVQMLYGDLGRGGSERSVVRGKFLVQLAYTTHRDSRFHYFYAIGPSVKTVFRSLVKMVLFYHSSFSIQGVSFTEVKKGQRIGHYSDYDWEFWDWDGKKKPLFYSRPVDPMAPHCRAVDRRTRLMMVKMSKLVESGYNNINQGSIRFGLRDLRAAQKKIAAILKRGTRGKIISKMV